MSRAALARLLGFSALVFLAPHAGPNGGAVMSAANAQARERTAYVSVIDRRTQQPVRDLTADALIVREDGARREILRMTPASSPMPVAVVVDNSEAAAATIPDLRKGLTAFLKTIANLGPVGLFTVGDRPTVLQAYTTSQADLLRAAGRLFHAPSSGATLLDTLADVSRGLARRDEDRAAIVVVTGENTEFSNRHYSDVLDRLRDSGAMMYAVVLLNPQGSADTEEARSRAVVLDRGPRDSGGVRLDVLTSLSFEDRLAVIGAMLTSQYRVTYARPPSLLPPERFEVATTSPDFEARGAPARGQGAK